MSSPKENDDLIHDKKLINKHNVNAGILFSQKRSKVNKYWEEKQKEKDNLAKEEPEVDRESDEESEDEDEATLWDNHPAEENDSDDELEVVCRPAERNQPRTNRSTPYTVPTPDYSQTFLHTLSQVAHQHMNDDAILQTLKSLIAPLMLIPNKQQQLYRSLCIPETEGHLAGVTLLEFVTILNFPKVTAYLVKFIFKECFTHPADALPYFRQKDSEGNTLIHDVVAVKGASAITALRVLLNVRFRRETSFVFEPTAVNNKGQHPLHLTMNSPVFQREVFHLFDSLGLGILKSLDLAGNSLLHYALINHRSICHGISSIEEKANHMTEYLQAMLSFDEIKDCVSIRNAQAQTPADILGFLDHMEALVQQRIRDQLSNVSFQSMIRDLDDIPLNLPQDVLLDQIQLDAVLQENGINVNNENEAAPVEQMPQLQNLFPAQNQVDVVSEEVLLGWVCTYILDPNCNATFNTKEEKDTHMREVHNAFGDDSDGFDAIPVDFLGLVDGGDILL